MCMVKTTFSSDMARERCREAEAEEDGGCSMLSGKAIEGACS